MTRSSTPNSSTRHRAIENATAKLDQALVSAFAFAFVFAPGRPR